MLPYQARRGKGSERVNMIEWGSSASTVCSQLSTSDLFCSCLSRVDLHNKKIHKKVFKTNFFNFIFLQVLITHEILDLEKNKIKLPFDSAQKALSELVIKTLKSAQATKRDRRNNAIFYHSAHNSRTIRLTDKIRPPFDSARRVYRNS